MNFNKICPYKLAHEEQNSCLLCALDVDVTRKPLLSEIAKIGPLYHKWVHRPVKGSPKFFSSKVLENLTKTPWYIVPIIWLPIALFLSAIALHSDLLFSAFVICLVGGVLIWQMLEYILHRFLFHLCPESTLGIKIHFIFHGCHHKFPYDGLRLVFPPFPAAIIAMAIYYSLCKIVNQLYAIPIFAGIMYGYILYDCMHYFMHHGSTMKLILPLKKLHLNHHFRSTDSGFGITSPLFDIIFSTCAKKNSQLS